MRPRPVTLTTLVLALVTAACTAAAPGKSAPAAASATAGTSDGAQAPASIGADAWLVVGRAGDEGLRVMLASSGEANKELPVGVPDATWGRLVTVTPGSSPSIVREVTVQQGAGGAERTIDGRWRLPTVGLDPLPVGVSTDGSTVVLVEDRAEGATAPTVSRFAVLDRSLHGKPRIIELHGDFAYDTLSPDGAILYVAEHVPDPLEGRYQVRAVDTATGVMREAIIVDKRNIDEAMAGWPLDQEIRPDGLVLTLYRGVEHPFIHALNTVDAWAVCIDLPAVGMADTAAATDWGLVATPDGLSDLAVNASLGIVVDVHPTDLTVRRTAAFAPVGPAAARGVTLAKFGDTGAGAVGRRVVAAPDGSAVLAAGAGGIVRIGTATLTVTMRALEGTAVDAIAITPDGTTVYALVRDGGRIARIDALSGEVLGWVPGGSFTLLVGIVPS